MWIAETIDLDDHDSVVRFMKNQSDRIKKLEKENKHLKSFVKGTCIFCGANLEQQYIEKYGDVE